MKIMFWIPPFIAGLLGVKTIQKSMGGKLPSKGYSALVLGDSHTVPSNGWFEAMAKKSRLGATAKLAANGRTTAVMLSTLRLYLAGNKAPNYIFMWGGGNDAYNGISPSVTLANIQAMIDLANSRGSTFIIVKGYNPEKVSYNFDLSKMFRGATQQSMLNARNNYVKLLAAYNNLKGNFKVVEVNNSFTRADSTDGLHLKADKYPILGAWVASQIFANT